MPSLWGLNSVNGLPASSLNPSLKIHFLCCCQNVFISQNANLIMTCLYFKSLNLEFLVTPYQQKSQGPRDLTPLPLHPLHLIFSNVHTVSKTHQSPLLNSAGPHPSSLGIAHLAPTSDKAKPSLSRAFLSLHSVICVHLRLILNATNLGTIMYHGHLWHSSRHGVDA